MVKYTIKKTNSEETFIYKGKKMEFTYKISALSFYRKLSKSYPEYKLRLIREENSKIQLIKKSKILKDL